jgi:CO dehydrogenase maturation factor
MHVAEIVLVINQVRENSDGWPDEVLQVFGEDKIVCLPADPLLARFDFEGKATITLPGDANVVRAADAFFDRVFTGKVNLL